MVEGGEENFDFIFRRIPGLWAIKLEGSYLFCGAGGGNFLRRSLKERRFGERSCSWVFEGHSSRAADAAAASRSMAFLTR